jgi:hypothetical protein
MQLLDALKAEKEKLGRQMASIDRTIQELSGEVVKKLKRKGKMSEAGKKKVAEAQRKRWAKVRAAKKAAEKKA